MQTIAECSPPKIKWSSRKQNLFRLENILVFQLNLVESSSLGKECKSAAIPSTGLEQVKRYNI